MLGSGSKFGGKLATTFKRFKSNKRSQSEGSSIKEQFQGIKEHGSKKQNNHSSVQLCYKCKLVSSGSDSHFNYWVVFVMLLLYYIILTRYCCFRSYLIVILPQYLNSVWKFKKKALIVFNFWKDISHFLKADAVGCDNVVSEYCSLWWLSKWYRRCEIIIVIESTKL